MGSLTATMTEEIILTQQQIEALMMASATPVEDHRRHKRREYPLVQAAAPAHSGQLPGSTAFQQVRCRDISQGGLAFYWQGIPDFSEVVLALGPRPEMILIRGRIVRSKALDDGSGRYVVGCKFIERVQASR